MTRLFTLMVTLAWVGFVFYLGTLPRTPGVPAVPSDLESLFSHFGAYLMLAALVYILASSSGSPSLLSRVRAAAVAIGIAVVMGVALEGVQSLLPERAAQVSDVVVDVAGAVTGAVGIFILDQLRVNRVFLSAAATGSALVAIAFFSARILL
jgi:VanZ family protein